MLFVSGWSSTCLELVINLFLSEEYVRALLVSCLARALT